MATLPSRRQFHALLAAAFSASASAQQVGGRSRNFVFILMDDLGWADLSCYGSTYYETPNLDRLAAQGVRFEEAYAAAPVCSPTRASIMTGKYPARLGITNYLPGGHPLPNSRLISAETTQQLPLSETTVAELLRDRGYRTAHIGKWHLGPRGYWPEQQGFERNIGGTDSGMPRSFFYPEWGDNPPITAKPGEYLTDKLTDEAERFLREHRQQPFFLYLPHYAVHVPIEAKRELVEKYRRKQPKGPQNDPVYAAMIESMDQSVGRIVSVLRELKLLETTMIFFTSDNGGLSAPEWKLKPVTSNAPLREGKGHLYEGGIRVPLIVSGGGVAPGRIVRDPVCSVDFLPTMLSAADPSWKSPSDLDGVSLHGQLFDEPRRPSPRTFCWHYPHYSNQQGRPSSAIRMENFKLIEFHEDGRAELYDIREDPGETKDLSAVLPERTDALRHELNKWRKSMHVRMPTVNPDFDPRRADQGYWWQLRERP
jgi:arylsulfatase A-like enzyme